MPYWESAEYLAQQAAAQKALQDKVDAGLGGFFHGNSWGGTSYKDFSQDLINARNEAKYWGVNLNGTEQGPRDARYSDPITDAAVLNQQIAAAKARADALTARYANAGVGRWTAMTADDLKGANDWARQNILNALGYGDKGPLAGQQLADNYKGWKANSNTNDVLNPLSNGYSLSTMDHWERDAKLASERAAYNADPEGYINKRLANIKDWTVGGDNNQQYVFNPKTGQLMNQWTHNTDESYLAAPLLIAGLGAAGVLGGLGGAAAGEGIGAATIGSQTLTPALMESAMGSAGYGLSSASGLLGGAAAGGGALAADALSSPVTQGAVQATDLGTLGDATVNGYADVGASQVGDATVNGYADLANPADIPPSYNPGITNSTLADSAAGTPGYGASSVGSGGSGLENLLTNIRASANPLDALRTALSDTSGADSSSVNKLTSLLKIAGGLGVGNKVVNAITKGSSTSSVSDLVQNALNSSAGNSAQTFWDQWNDTTQPGLTALGNNITTAANDNMTAQKGIADSVMHGADQWLANDMPWLHDQRDAMHAQALDTYNRMNSYADGVDNNFHQYFDPVYSDMRTAVNRYNDPGYRQTYLDQSAADQQRMIEAARQQDMRRRMAMGANPNSGAFNDPNFMVQSAQAKADALNKMRLALDDKYTTGLGQLGQMGEFASNYGIDSTKAKTAATSAGMSALNDANNFGLNVGNQTQNYGNWMTNASNAASTAWGKGVAGLSSAGDYGINAGKLGQTAASTAGSILDGHMNAASASTNANANMNNSNNTATNNWLNDLGAGVSWTTKNWDTGANIKSWLDL